MPENDFEKQVQQKMDELQFVPSDAVWPEVERQIEQRKKRRGVFFWLPFGAVLFLGGAAWLFFSGIGNGTNNKKTIGDKVVLNEPAINKNNDRTVPAADNAVAGDKDKSENVNDNAGIPSAEKKSLVSKKADASIAASKKTVLSSALKNNIDKASKTNLALANTQKENNTSAIYSRKDEIKSNTHNSKHLVKNKNHKAQVSSKNLLERTNTTVVSDKNDKDEAVDKLLSKLNDIVSSVNVTDSIGSEELIATVKAQKDSSVHVKKSDSTTAIAKTKTSHKAKKKIEWGINVNAGVSSISSGFSGLFSSTPTYDAAAFSNNQQPAPGNINAGGLSNAVTQPSKIKAGFSYSAGVFVSVPLNKKFNFLTGINYAYHSNSIHTGAKSDSLFTHYALGNSTNYTNKFHFIELPITLQLHTTRFSINAGLSFSILAGSNALLYDTQGKYYYQDNTRINKFQTGLVAGFSYRLFPKKMPLEIGPQFNYSLSNIFNKDLYGSRHLFFGGINAKLLLHKK